MKTLTINVQDPSGKIWDKLPPAAQQLLASQALDALLRGELFPTGTEQLELAIDLAEAGVDAEIISQLSRLDKDIFMPYIKK